MKSKLIRWIITFIFITIFAVLLLKVDFEKTGEAFREANLVLVGIAMLFFLFSYLLKAFRLKLLCKTYGKEITLKDSLFTQIISIALASFTPGRVGEFSKIYLLNRYGAKGGKSFGIVIVERLLDLVIIGFFSLIFFSLIFNIGNLVFMSILFIVGIIAGFLFLANIDRFISIVPKFLRKYVKEIKFEFKNSLFYGVILMSIVIWCADGFGIFLVLNSFTSVSYLASVGVMCSMTLISIFSILPGGIGAIDASIFPMLAALGVSAEMTFAILVIVRVITFALPFLLAIIVSPFVDYNIFKLREKGKENI